MTNRPDRVQIWSAQLAANDFPPVCAMTGRPAEKWRKFNFATPPWWTYVLLLLTCIGGLGIIAYAIVVWAVAERASGHLPLTRSSSRTVSLLVWLPVSLIFGGVIAWIAAITTGLSSNDHTGSTVAAILFWLGLLFLGAGIAGRLLLMPLICPKAKVMEQQQYQHDKVVELRNMHPVFVAAVNRMHADRAAQYAAIQAGPGIPSLPGST